MSDWVVGGMLKGNNRLFCRSRRSSRRRGIPTATRRYSGHRDHDLEGPFRLDGLVAEKGRRNAGFSVLPDAASTAALALQYSDKYRHPFLLRKPLSLRPHHHSRRASAAVIVLLPASSHGKYELSQFVWDFPRVDSRPLPDAARPKRAGLEGSSTRSRGLLDVVLLSASGA